MSQLRYAANDDVPAPLRAGVSRLREALGVPAEFPADVLAEAAAAASGVVWPDADRTDLEFVTIDPEGAKDLDQAMYLERLGEGYRVFYAIADVAAFVRPGGLIDAECHRRGVTFYAPSLRTPLHPPILSEGAASLLAGQDRPALLWQIDLDAAGAITATSVTRARVRSRAQLTYTGVQAALDEGTASPSLQLLREVGQLRFRAEVRRGGVSLQTPEQEVVAAGGAWVLDFRKTLPVEDWNAQISLLTGVAAARLMVEAKVGILRTLPPAQQADVARLRHIARGLKLPWPASWPYPEFVRSLDPAVPTHAAMLTACTSLFRGAGYAAFDGTVPAQPFHAALATEYAHVTAPLRRLVDRYAGEACLAICAGRPVPEWVRSALPLLPAELGAADGKARKYERGIVDLVEALVLAPHVGEVFDATVIEVNGRGQDGIVQLVAPAPAVQARAQGPMTLGAEISVRLVSVDLEAGGVVLKVAG